MADFTLTPLPPFRLDLTVWVLRRLPINQMDRWDGRIYRRVLMPGDTPVEVAVVQGGSARAPQLTVTARGARLGGRTCEALISTLDKMLGLSVDLYSFRHLAEGDQRLAGLIDPFIGFKPPRRHSVFETLVNGIACQQLSLQVGMLLLNRLCRAYGLASANTTPSRVPLISHPLHLRSSGDSVSAATSRWSSSLLRERPSKGV
jgi:DNA-3-methyladenine glycosylase II